MSGQGLKSACGWLSIVVFCTALAAGGATRQGFVSDSIIQLASLPLLGLSIILASRRPASRETVIPLVIAAAVAFVPVLQLVPLPPKIWSALPGRDFVLASFVQAGMTPPWMPISLSPEATLRSLLSLAPPTAIFLAAAFLDLTSRYRLILALIVAAGLNVVLGLAQIVGGPDSPLRFYAFTNVLRPVGFFANTNHFSAVLYGAMPYIGAIAIWLIRSRRADALVTVAWCLMIYVVMMLGVSIAGSRAGLALAIVAGLGVIASAWIKRAASDAPPGALKPWLFVGGTCAILMLLFFEPTRITSLIDGSVLRDARVGLAGTTWAAARSFTPFGSGFGTFMPIYLMFEDPKTATSESANRAHNDPLELWLEAGVPVAAVMLALLAWFVVVSVRIWRGRNDDYLALMLERASTIVIALLALHSFVDYPLRTTALACVFALACGNLFPAAPSRDRQFPLAPKPARSKQQGRSRTSVNYTARGRT